MKLSGLERGHVLTYSAIQSDVQEVGGDTRKRGQEAQPQGCVVN